MTSATVFFDRTNQTRNPQSENCKRKAENDEDSKGTPEKRVKFSEEDTREEHNACDDDVEMSHEGIAEAQHFTPRRDLFSSLMALRMGNPMARRTFTMPTIKILQTFVSSNKADLYKCHSLSANAFITLPYACSFSNASKRGECSTLAVATEHGTVDIINTTKRREWDQECARSTLDVHDNGIFDVKWSPNDRVLATASGDNSIRISDPHAWRGEPLHVLSEHSGTVKCLAWDPNHTDLLASAGRDGSICLWDLRESRRRDDDLEVDDDDSIKPIYKYSYTHEDSPGRPIKKGKTVLAARQVTSLIYSPTSPYEIISSGNADGILRKWDLRSDRPSPKMRSKKLTKSEALLPVDQAVDDLTKVAHNLSDIGLTCSPRRSRGIVSMCLGSGPTAGKIFALANDSRVHTYNPRGAANLPLDIPQTNDLPYTHRHMSTNSFYVRIGTSPCGRWLASGGTHGSAFLFDVGSKDSVGVELRGQEGEVGALDWAENTLATCADDGTVRIWRPDLDRYRACRDNQDEEQHGWSWAKL